MDTPMLAQSHMMYFHIACVVSLIFDKHDTKMISCMQDCCVSVEEAKKICKQNLESQGFLDIEVVYGMAGMYVSVCQ